MRFTLDYTDYVDVAGGHDSIVSRVRGDYCPQLAACLEQLGGDPAACRRIAQEAFDRMIEPGRFYHTPAHVLGIFQIADRRRVTLSPGEQVAVWFHDVIYDAVDPDNLNEARSAQWAKERLTDAGVDPAAVRFAAEAILSTAHHLDDDVPQAHHMIMDMDLAGLAAPAPVFARMSRAVQNEFHAIPEADYFQGRVRFFNGLLDRRCIFRTPQFHDLEAPARRQLKGEIDRLQAVLGVSQRKA